MTTETKRPWMKKAAILGSISSPQNKQSKQRSRLIKNDPFDYNETDAIPMPYNPYWLADYMVKCSEHADAVNLKADNIASEVMVVPVEGQETESKREGTESLKSEEKRIWKILDEINPDLPLIELIRREQLDFHSIGGAYKEILRYPDGTIQQWNHAPAVDMRIRGNYIGYIQEIGETYRYFKRFGDKELPMSYRTGKINLSLQEIQDYFFKNHNIVLTDDRAKFLSARTGDYRPEDEATEIFDFQKYHPGSRTYGLPDCISCIGAMELIEKSEEYNYHFFGNHAMARFAIIVRGPEDAIPPEFEKLIGDYINAATKGNSNVGRSIYLPVPPHVEISFEKLDAEIKEGSFLSLVSDSSMRIARSERVPLDLLQISHPQGIGGTRVKQALEQFKMFVIGRGQEFLEHRINKNLIWGEHGLKINNWQIKFREFDITNMAEDSDVFAKIDKAQCLGYKEKRAFGQRLGIINDIELGEDDVILVPANLVNIYDFVSQEGNTPAIKKSAELEMAEGINKLQDGYLRMRAKLAAQEVEHEPEPEPEPEPVEVE